jgi:hypothetical protein
VSPQKKVEDTFPLGWEVVLSYQSVVKSSVPTEMLFRKFLSVSFVICAAFLLSQPSLLASTVSELLEPAQRPNVAFNLPDGASYYHINSDIFRSAASRKHEITSIQNILLNGKRVNLLLEQFEVLTSDAQVLLGSGKGDRTLSTPRHVLLHGTVEGEADSHVYLAVFDSYAIGYIDIHHGDELDRYQIQPLKNAGEGEPTIIISKVNPTAASSGSGWTCGSEEFAPNIPRMEKLMQEIRAFDAQSTKGTKETLANPMVHLLSIAIECDSTYYVAHNSDTVAGINYVLAVVGAQSDIYQRDLRCGLFVGFLRIWMHDDPYTGADNGTMLGQLASYWHANMFNVHRAGTLLYTNKGGGGLAYVNALCNEGDNSYAFGVCGLNNNYTFPADGYIWDVDVSSHEFGHIVGSLHTHNCSWNPPIDSCVASEGGCYPTPKPTRGTIMSYCHLTSFGTELKFHPRVQKALTSTKINVAKCASFVELPVAIARPNRYVCPGGSVRLGRDSISGTAPYTYSWRPNLGLSTTTDEIITARPPKTTTYILTVEDANMLRGYDTVTVYVDEVLVSAGGDVSACGVKTVAVSADPRGVAPFHYTWTDASNAKVVGTTKDVVLPATTSKTYILHVTDSVGCDATDSMHVIISQKPNVQLAVVGDTVFCEGGSVMLDAGAGFGKYHWSSGATSQQLLVTKTGTYNVVVNNAGAGCADTSRSVTVQVNAFPTKPSISRSGDSLIASQAPSYQWYSSGNVIPNATTQILVVSASGSYTVKVKSAAGCEVASDAFDYSPSAVAATVTKMADVTLYPNPAKESLTISSVNNQLRSVVIRDVLGKEVMRMDNLTGKNNSNLVVDVHLLPEGVYFAHFTQFHGPEGTIRFVR